MEVTKNNLQLETTMVEQQEKIPLPQAPVNRLDPCSGHRILGDQTCHVEKDRSFSKPLRPKRKFFIGTLNVHTLRKFGKLKQLTNTLDKFSIKIVALQETRFTDEDHFDSENYRFYKGKPAVQINTGPKQFGTGFAVNKSVIDSIIDFSSPSERLSTLSIKSGNKIYTLINVHAPTNDYNRKDSRIVEDFWECLEEITNKIPGHHVKILLGDFNGQLGKERKYRRITGPFTAHRRTNKNGEHLLSFCQNFNLQIMSTQFQKPTRKLTTWISPNEALGGFQIDHVAISRRNVKEILNVKTRRGFFESDHHLLQIKVKFQPNRQRTRGTQLFRTDPEYLQLNKAYIIEEIRMVNTTNWSELAAKMKQAIKFGQPPRKRKHRWWNITCDQAIEYRFKAWNNFNSRKTAETWHEFVQVRKNTSKVIRREKRRYDNNRLIEIEQDFNKNNTRNFYKIFKENIVGYHPPSLCFERPEGSLETNTKNNCEILANYFTTLLNCAAPSERLRFVSPVPNPDSLPPSYEEIVDIIKSLKNNSAPGEDGLITEVWKLDHEHITPKIYRIILDIWTTERIPTEWKSALIHPLHKKGSKTDPNNYRGISLLPIAYKILSKALLNRLEPQVDQHIGEYQAGFRKGRSCIEQIWNLKTILHIRRCRNTTVTFVDFKKAYDSVDRLTLFNRLEELGVDRKTRSIIQETLVGTTSKVKFMGEISDSFAIQTGVRQGDGLSPLLFNIVLDKIISEWEKHVQGIQIGKEKGNRVTVKCLAFADDLAILTNNKNEALLALNKLHEIARKTGLEISYEKTQYMDTKATGRLSLRTQYGNISQVTHFKYLGETIQPTGLNTISNAERILKLQKAYKLTWNHYNKRAVSRNAKLRHYSTVVLPEALYAAETTVIKGMTRTQDLEKQERKILRKIHGAVLRDGIWIKRPTKELYTNTDTIIDKFRKRRLQFYGHICRMHENRLTKKIFNIANASKLKTNWIKEVHEDMVLFKISEDDIQDRGKFRILIRNTKIEQISKKDTAGKKWTEERKKKHSELMKRFWEDKKRGK